MKIPKLGNIRFEYVIAGGLIAAVAVVALWVTRSNPRGTSLRTKSAENFEARVESRMKREELEEMLKGKLVSLSIASVATEAAKVFLIARDSQTRRLEWYLVDPAAKQVLKNGPCPFEVFHLSAVSPNAKTAMVFTELPRAAWVLDITTGVWNRILKNQTGEGPAIVKFSPLGFVSDTAAITILDKKDKDGVVADSVITVLSNNNPPGLREIVSLGRLRSLARSKLSLDESKKASVGLVRNGDEKSFVFTLETGSESVLFRFEAPDRLTLIDRSDKPLFPLDYDPLSGDILYEKLDLQPEVILAHRNDREKITQGKALAGYILRQGELLGLVMTEGENFNVLLGSHLKKPQRIIEAKDIYGIGLDESGLRIVMLNVFEVITLSVHPVE